MKNLHEIKNHRHGGTYKDRNAEVMNSNSDIYDWIVDIDLITKITKEGWEVQFSKNFLNSSSMELQKHVFGDRLGDSGFKEMSNEKQRDSFRKKDSQKKLNNNRPDVDIGGFNPHNWEGAIVAVVGLYDKGKTFCLNNLSFSNLPSGKKVNTKGLSFKYVNIDEGTKLIILDTAGSYSPVKVENNMSIVEKEATEMFILDLVFEISDYFLFVVNDFTSLDQRYLDKLTRYIIPL